VVNETLSIGFLTLAAGSILYVVIELLAVARKQALKEITTWGILLGVLLGFATDAIVTAADRGADVVVTTGGTGLGPRDVTPQATSAVIDFEVPGIGEAMRRAGAASTPMAALSRSMAGVRGQTLIINVPGSPRGAAESLEAVVPVLAHAIKLLHGDTKHG